MFICPQVVYAMALDEMLPILDSQPQRSIVCHWSSAQIYMSNMNSTWIKMVNVFRRRLWQFNSTTLSQSYTIKFMCSGAFLFRWCSNDQSFTGCLHASYTEECKMCEFNKETFSEILGTAPGLETLWNQSLISKIQNHFLHYKANCILELYTFPHTVYCQAWAPSHIKNNMVVWSESVPVWDRQTSIHSTLQSTEHLVACGGSGKPSIQVARESTLLTINALHIELVTCDLHLAFIHLIQAKLVQELETKYLNVWDSKVWVQRQTFHRIRCTS